MDKKIEEIIDFAESESSIIERGKRYKTDVEYMRKYICGLYLEIDRVGRVYSLVPTINYIKERQSEILADIVELVENCHDYGYEAESLVLNIVKIIYDYKAEPMPAAGAATRMVEGV